VPWSWKGRTIPLLPHWAVRPVQSLSAFTPYPLPPTPISNLPLTNIVPVTWQVCYPRGCRIC